MIEMAGFPEVYLKEDEDISIKGIHHLEAHAFSLPLLLKPI